MLLKSLILATICCIACTKGAPLPAVTPDVQADTPPLSGGGDADVSTLGDVADAADLAPRATTDADQAADVIQANLDAPSPSAGNDAPDILAPAEEAGAAADTGTAVSGIDAPEDNKDGPGPCSSPTAPSGLPTPGEACLKEGELRCTAQGAFGAWILYGQAQGGINTCVLPNRVQCTKSNLGKLAWALLACPQLDVACSSNAAGTVVHSMCQDLPGGAVCGPTAISVAGGIDAMCPDSLQGKRFCDISGGDSSFVTVCASYDTPVADPVAAQIKKDKFQTAATCAGKALYWFPEENCGSVNICNCLGLNIEVCPPKAIYAQACSTNLPGKQGIATCATTCEQMKYTEQWGPMFKNPP